MTDQEQDIAVALGLGWIKTTDGKWYQPPFFDEGQLVDSPLRYGKCLNAMHEAVSTLDKRTLAYSNYCSHLNQIVAIENSKSLSPGIQAVDATAAQRREAYLRTLNLYVE